MYCFCKLHHVCTSRYMYRFVRCRSDRKVFGPPQCLRNGVLLENAMQRTGFMYGYYLEESFGWLSTTWMWNIQHPFFDVLVSVVWFSNWQTITTSAALTGKGSLIRDSPQTPLTEFRESSLCLLYRECWHEKMTSPTSVFQFLMLHYVYSHSKILGFLPCRLSIMYCIPGEVRLLSRLLSGLFEMKLMNIIDIGSKHNDLTMEFSRIIADLKAMNDSSPRVPTVSLVIGWWL